VDIGIEKPNTLAFLPILLFPYWLLPEFGLLFSGLFGTGFCSGPVFPFEGFFGASGCTVTTTVSGAGD
jgi:hypothetical protein